MPKADILVRSLLRLLLSLDFVVHCFFGGLSVSFSEVSKQSSTLAFVDASAWLLGLIEVVSMSCSFSI